MATTSTSSFPSVFLPILFLLLAIPCYASDPDPLQDLCVADFNSSASVNGFPCKPVSNVASGDFFFDGLAKEGNTSNPFGASVTTGNVLTFPGLNTLGMSMNRVDLAPGGLNTPHSHPRATELGIVVAGNVLVGFVTTGNVFYSKVVGPGEVFVVPRGLVHFQRNVGEGKALIFTSFNSQQPGAALIASTLFAATPTIPSEVLAQALQVDESLVNQIKSKFGS